MFKNSDNEIPNDGERLNADHSISLGLIVPFIVVTASLIFRIVSHPHFINTDVAMYLQCAQLILEGKIPYVDFVDILPPFSFYFFLPPVFFMQYLNLPLPLIVDTYIVAFIFYSLCASFIVLHSRIRACDWLLLCPLLFGFLIFNLPAFFHFGQKEHVFSLVFLPYFLMRWLRYENKSFNPFFSILVGIVTSIGASSKLPYFAIVIIAVETYWLLKSKHIKDRLVDPEVLGLAITTLSYLLLFIAFSPVAMRDAFLFRWMPLTLKGYGAYFCSLPTLLSCKKQSGLMLKSIWTLAIVCGLALVMKRRHTLIMPLFVWTAAGYLIYLIQNKGWAYQMLIAVTGYFLLASFEIAYLARSIAIQIDKTKMSKLTWTTSLGTFFIFSVLLAPLSSLLICDSLASGRIDSVCVEKIVRSTACCRDAIAVLSYWPMLSYPCLINTDCRPASRYLWQYPLRMYEYLKFNSHSQLEQINYEKKERQVVRELYEGIEKSQPKLIIIDKQSPPWNRSWTIFSYLYQNDFEKILANYKPNKCWKDFWVWTRKAQVN